MGWVDRIDRQGQEIDASRMLGRKAPARAIRLLAVLLLVSGTFGCAGISVKQHAILDREAVESASAQSSSTSEAIQLIQAGRKIDRSHPETAISYYREAALLALPEALREGVATDEELVAPNSAQRTYRRAIEYAIITADRQGGSRGVGWGRGSRSGGIGVRGRVGAHLPEEWTKVEPSRSFRVSGMRHMNAREGLGAPLCLTRRLPFTLAPPEDHFSRVACLPAGAVLRPGDGPGDPPAILELHDPIREPATSWIPAEGGSPVPLAFDLTTPLARQFQDTKLNLVGPLSLFFPSSFDGRSGIYMIDPYDPSKIPVIFVHGLMSSPLAWTNAMNDLRGDPALRERYQFWMFFYSTGNSIAKSATILRSSLIDIQREFDPAETNPAFDQTILIGHSMGGLLSRIAVSSSGDSVWNAIFKVPPDRLDIKPEYREMLRSLTQFDPVPTIRRVVFVSTPHRGSPLGDAFIGRLSSSLIWLPTNVEDFRDAILNNKTYTKIKPEFLKNRQLTSIAQLGQKSPIIPIINNLKISEDVPYHSIVGYDGKVPLPAGSDGVVPYESAHIEGALSELVVSSDHSAQETQEAIVEMRRILMLHLEEYDAATAALTRGEIPAARITRPTGPTPVRYEFERDDRGPELIARPEPDFPNAVSR